jgi:thiamine pyrophosphate-dependent acetolactate synthase large subunit-like protein
MKNERLPVVVVVHRDGCSAAPAARPTRTGWRYQCEPLEVDRCMLARRFGTGSFEIDHPEQLADAFGQALAWTKRRSLSFLAAHRWQAS